MRWLNTSLFQSLTLITFGIALDYSFHGMAYAQETLSSNRRTVVDAIRSIDTSSERELESISAFLEQMVEKNDLDPVANCALAIAQFRAQLFDQANKSFDRSVSDQSSKIVRPTSGKFQLVCAINKEDVATATHLFQSMLSACQRETVPLPLRKSYCEWMGEIIGTLDFEEAKSPIPLDTLTKAKRSLLGIPETKLSQAFESQYALSHSRAKEVRTALLRFLELGEAGLQDVEKQLANEITIAEQSLAESLKETRDVANETQNALRTLRLESMSVRDQIRKIDADSARPGPGMPAYVAPPLGPPPRPIREAIYVEPFFVRVVIDYIDGRPVERIVRERRDFRDMEIERNNIFQSHLIQYQTLLDQFNFQRSLYSQYQKELATWKRSEEERRSQLAIQRRELEGIAIAIKSNIDALESKKKDNSVAIELRNRISEMQSQREAIRQVLVSAKSGNPHLALRPRTLTPSLITDEKNLLLKQLTSVQ